MRLPSAYDLSTGGFFESLRPFCPNATFTIQRSQYFLTESGYDILCRIGGGPVRHVSIFDEELLTARSDAAVYELCFERALYVYRLARGPELRTFRLQRHSPKYLKSRKHHDGETRR